MQFRVEVWGDYACFTRPEFKTERVSYPVITPSAAIGVLESIYYHPGMIWVIDKIQVLNPIKFGNVRRNEVSEVLSAKAARRLMETREGEMYLATSECIAQRAAMILKDVRYVIEAHIELVPEKMNPSDNMLKFEAIVQKRLACGGCYSQPYLGCREFTGNFAQCKETFKCPDKLRGEKDFGWMLWNFDYTDPANIVPCYFRAILKNGELVIPVPGSREVLK